ncbi:cyclase family protein [Halorarum salinum]|uniref:Cyclase family protein n=1 Tax=Halorarum salinum TaxID=2743089 RepID=A0A7D5Q7T3_9EURY|nr:cyclase family protein [Halobaculum salinum]QLG60296.1 cyclase family protein [Halobaculum salinum]
MWIDLSQPFSEDMPHPASMPSPEFSPVRDVDDDGINVQKYQLITHVGTHVDAPYHFIPDGKKIDEISLEKMNGQAIVIDIPKRSPEEITVDDVKSKDAEIRENDIVILNTGWHSKYGDEDYEPHPWLNTEVAEWFVEKKINMLCMDVLTPDLPWSLREEGWNEFPVHQTLLENEVLIAENLGNLDEVGDERIELFGSPIEIQGGDGSPARFVARRG